jgi:phosphoadenosine phosphosulfate reductase
MEAHQLIELEKEFENVPLKEALQLIAARFPGKVSFSTSFGMEDQVITHIIGKNKIPMKVFTLDTGRLFNETYEVWSSTANIFDLQIDPYYPDAAEIQGFVREKGINSMYLAVENRKECCRIRKIEPLKRALKGVAVWVTGVRAAQSANRQNFKLFEWDEAFQTIKFNPLLYWSDQDVADFIHQNHTPYNKLHDQGFLSIGCAPCTRAIQFGEDPRAGRWWWEDSKKECGLHETKVLADITDPELTQNDLHS